MKTFEGKVVANNMQKTAIVEVTQRVAHPLYKKLLKRTKRHSVDVGYFEVGVGNVVQIMETRPISKNKHFKIVRVIGGKPAVNASEVATKEAQNENELKKRKKLSEVKNESAVAKTTVAKKSVRRKK